MRKIEVIKGKTYTVTDVRTGLIAYGMDLEDAIHEMVGKLLDRGDFSYYDYCEFSHFCTTGRILEYFDLEHTETNDPYGSD